MNAKKPITSPLPAIPVRCGLAAWCLLIAGLISSAAAAGIPSLQILADQGTHPVSPMLYGLMTEEINYSYDGGLYAELIVNRNFKENRRRPVWWRLFGDTNDVSMWLDTNHPLNSAVPASLRVEVEQASAAQPAGVANEGYWGIPVKPNTRYQGTIYAKAAEGFDGPLTLAIVGTNGTTVYASQTISRLTSNWKKYEVSLSTRDVKPTKDALLAITTTRPGTIWLGFVSLFPPTYRSRPNGNRIDIMQLLAEMKPAFLRFPGGNYLEGNTLATRFNWKNTIGDISQRPGHLNDAWGYWSSDGMGLLEFLEWCEDLHMQPVLGVFNGYCLRGGGVPPGPECEPYVREALEEIEYVVGDTSTEWGARRAKDGHRAAFKLEYVEIGNEDPAGAYDARFTQFHDAIKAKYPNLKLIATTRVQTRAPDMVDNHYYPAPQAMIALSHRYDTNSRSGPKIFVGEYATREGNSGPITPSLEYAVADAAFLTGLERNSDVVLISSYAPLFVNVNPGGAQWRTDLIGYDALGSFGSPSYYVQKMFNLNRGDVILPVNAENVPMTNAPAADAGGGAEPPQPTAEMPTLLFVATRDTAHGAIYLKLVNTSAQAQPVQVEVKGVKSVASQGQSIVLTGDDPTDTNSVKDPMKLMPVAEKIDGLGTMFTRTLAKNSVTILRLSVK